jgi:cytochrome c-type biogenesis protein
MDVAQLSLAFTAGALAFLSPCALPMIPVYLSYYISSERAGKRLASGILQSFSVSAGFILVFFLVGIIPSLIAAEFLKFVWLAAPVLGFLLIIIGLLTGWTTFMDRLPRLNLQIEGGGQISFLTYGIAYGVASLGCSLPVFMIVVLQGASAKSLIEVFWLFAAYGSGAAALIIPLTITLTLAKDLLHKRLLAALPFLKKVNGLVLILAGIYMIYTGLKVTTSILG